MLVEYRYLANSRVDKQRKSSRLHFSFGVVGFRLPIGGRRYNFFFEKICGGRCHKRPPLEDILEAR